MTTVTSQSAPAPSPLAAVLDAAAVYAAAPVWSYAPPTVETFAAAKQVCMAEIEAALGRCGADGVPQLVFELAFRLALRDQP